MDVSVSNIFLRGARHFFAYFMKNNEVCESRRQQRFFPFFNLSRQTYIYYVLVWPRKEKNVLFFFLKVFFVDDNKYVITKKWLM